MKARTTREQQKESTKRHREMDKLCAILRPVCTSQGSDLPAYQ